MSPLFCVRLSERCVTSYCAGPSDWRPVRHSYSLLGLSTSKAFQSANAGPGGCKCSPVFRYSQWFLFIGNVCEHLSYCMPSLGFGYVQPVMAELLIPVTLPSDATFLRNLGVRLRVCFGAVSWRHCGHLYQHSEVMPTLPLINVLKKFTMSYQTYLMRLAGKM